MPSPVAIDTKRVEAEAFRLFYENTQRRPSVPEEQKSHFQIINRWNSMKDNVRAPWYEFARAELLRNPAGTSPCPAYVGDARTRRSSDPVDTQGVPYFDEHTSKDELDRARVPGRGRGHEALTYGHWSMDPQSQRIAAPALEADAASLNQLQNWNFNQAPEDAYTINVASYSMDAYHPFPVSSDSQNPS
ncbi:hypothetical protein CYLTODRAFT_453658 [Cylindrobasidium torrendii FP15055 ss-10]|uniref:Uncharacterized protein n=1 Tax=Cylindrobasidium torrendii FP15055 ss-10 TaxID=1314674 RepID=A0A0D7BDN5_9AGAR|nr:hypothetical protein CYLTODRAFT_453658 [Cylindrobasidium torrendii FP15055 ss-10]